MQGVFKMHLILYGMTIGKNIRKLRKAKGITQVELAKKLKTTQQVITSYERGINKPDPDKIPNIAKALGVSVDELYDVPKEVIQNPVERNHKNTRVSKITGIVQKLKPEAQRTVLNLVKNLAK